MASVTKCVCGSRVTYSGRGRPRQFCSQSCRQAAYVGRRMTKGRRGGFKHGGWTASRQLQVAALRRQGLSDERIAELFRIEVSCLPANDGVAGVTKRLRALGDVNA